MNFFITAIGTDSGKTLVSAILVEALKADYWKPVQAGSPTDMETVKKLIANSVSRFHPETYCLKSPESPHSAAQKENIRIELNKFELPHTHNHLIVEGAGGALVPLNDDDYVIDIALKFKLEVIIISNLYLGSINHSLLTIEALNNRGIKIKGIVFNGNANPFAEEIILKKSGLPCLFRLNSESEIDKGIVSKYANLIRKQILELCNDKDE